MPQYPHRPIVQAVDRLTAQMKRIADTLEDRPIDENAVAELAELRRALDPDEERYIDETVDEQARLNAKIQEQQAAIERVHDLHRPDQKLCRICATPSPCATLTAAILTP